jgi:hypothetical protein
MCASKNAMSRTLVEVQKMGSARELGEREANKQVARSIAERIIKIKSLKAEIRKLEKEIQDLDSGEKSPDPNPTPPAIPPTYPNYPYIPRPYPAKRSDIFWTGGSSVNHCTSSGSSYSVPR